MLKFCCTLARPSQPLLFCTHQPKLWKECTGSFKVANRKHCRHEGVTDFQKGTGEHNMTIINKGYKGVAWGSRTLMKNLKVQQNPILGHTICQKQCSHILQQTEYRPISALLPYTTTEQSQWTIKLDAHHILKGIDSALSVSVGPINSISSNPYLSVTDVESTLHMTQS